MTAVSWVEITVEVIDVLDRLGIPYVIGGSAASIVHGLVRTTVDTDLVADIKHEHVADFLAALEREFFVQPEAIREALVRRTSFNVIHKNSMFKVDIFVPKPQTIGEAQLQRRKRKAISSDPERTAWVSSAEDIILAKLEWFRLGGEVSERQWRDVLGVLKTQARTLDMLYLAAAAKGYRVDDLLQAALNALDE